MCRRICAFVVRIWHKQVFSWHGSNMMIITVYQQLSIGRWTEVHVFGGWWKCVKMLKTGFAKSYKSVHYHLRNLMYRYFKNLKILDTQKNCCNYPKILTMWFYHRVMCPKETIGMAVIRVYTVCLKVQSNQGLHCLHIPVCLKTYYGTESSKLSFHREA